MSSDLRDDLQLIYRFFDDIGLDEDHYASEALCRLESAGLTITAAASGPVEQRVMDVERVIEVMRDASGRWAPNRGMGSLSTYMQQAVRAALAPASEEGA